MLSLPVLRYECVEDGSLSTKTVSSEVATRMRLPRYGPRPPPLLTCRLPCEGEQTEVNGRRTELCYIRAKVFVKSVFSPGPPSPSESW